MGPLSIAPGILLDDGGSGTLIPTRVDRQASLILNDVGTTVLSLPPDRGFLRMVIKVPDLTIEQTRYLVGVADSTQARSHYVSLSIELARGETLATIGVTFMAADGKRAVYGCTDQVRQGDTIPLLMSWDATRGRHAVASSLPLVVGLNELANPWTPFLPSRIMVGENRTILPNGPLSPPLYGRLQIGSTYQTVLHLPT